MDMSSPREYFLQEEVEEIDFRAILRLIRANILLISIFVIIALLIGGLYAMTRPPQYVSEALIQVSPEKNSAITSMIAHARDGDGASFGGNENIQIETTLMKSRYILGATAEKLGLGLSVHAKKLPVIGALYTKFHKNSGLAAPFLGLSGFAWGGESVEFEKINIPANLSGIKFSLVAGKDGHYTVYSPDKEQLLVGQVGRYAKSQSEKYPIGMLLSELVANPGAQFVIVSQSYDEVARGINNAFDIEEQEKGTGILKVSFRSGSPESAQNMLKTILQMTVAKNIQSKSLEMSKSLVFLEEQSPKAEKSLNSAEDNMVAYEAKNGMFLSGDMQDNPIFSDYNTLEKSIYALRDKREELLQRFTENHPFVIAVDDKEKELLREEAVLKEKLKELPREAVVAAGLQREVELRSKIYTDMLQNAEQIKILQGGMVSTVSILSDATYPVFPIGINKSKIVFVSAVLGFIMAIAVVLIRKALLPVIEDPAVVERKLGIATLAIVPFSGIQDQISRDLSDSQTARNTYLLASERPKDISIEALRSLRTSLKLSMLSAENNIICITGCSPGVGKSFISVNLTQLFANLGNKIIFIDTDLRKGHANKYFKTDRNHGLADYLKGDIDLSQAIRKSVVENIDFISTGAYPEHPSELLMGDKLPKLLQALGEKYDIILVDTPPILAVTDAALVLKHSATNLLVVGSGKDQFKEVEHAVGMLRKSGCSISGTVFNIVNKAAHRHGTGYGKYNYYYNYENRKVSAD